MLNLSVLLFTYFKPSIVPAVYIKPIIPGVYNKPSIVPGVYLKPIVPDVYVKPFFDYSKYIYLGSIF